ncbi:putative RNA-directed DNA polymerase from transposon X-element [Trichonephila clavipes]|uniref:Putative RNA-directed DNA polymerase from transposon X-element n=1 Tax=Trichonephila clavipes TaxID=2585209 RepID=A0A8X6RB59_TRICX|nr:putative RNA-directed DNA polymerase from transposon X-element [Trichonephila clavipes]
MRSTSRNFLEVLSQNKDTSVWLCAERHGGILCVRRRISSKTSTTPDPQQPTSISETKGKIKEQPSPLHRPRKHSKKIDLMSIKPTTNLKEKPFCSIYLPPNTAIHQHDLNNLVDQLAAPFIILGDFNGHSTLWGSVKTNHRGRQTEQVLSDHCLCLLNHEEPTYFHEPTRSFHTLDLAICSPSLLPHLNLSIEKDLHNSDHFSVILSHDSDTGGKTFPTTYSYSRADWALFTQLAVIPDAMVKTESVDTAVREVTNVLIAASDLSIPKVSSHSFQRYKPWWNTDCQTAYKNQRRLWGIFRRYPTTENLLAFKKAKENTCRVRRQSQRQSWIRYVPSLTLSTSSKQLWKKSVSSTASYNSRFLEIKRQAERTPINFSTRSFFPYNWDFTMTELQKALLQAHNTSPGSDGITYTMLRHLNPNSLANIIFLFNRVWKEHCFPSNWREAIVIPILKPGSRSSELPSHCSDELLL